MKKRTSNSAYIHGWRDLNLRQKFWAVIGLFLVKIGYLKFD